jgi:hypothetical protein
MNSLIGRTFGYLKVLKKLGTNGKKGGYRTLWRCLCVCGKERIAIGLSLKRGSITSCGCKGLAQGEGGLNRLLTSYQVRAKKRNIVWALSKEDFWDQTSQDCFYCGTPPAMIFTSTGLKDRSEDEWSTYIYNGLDRIDNNKGYEPDNVAPACAQCNKAKQDRSVEEFFSWIDVLHQRFTKSQLGSEVINRHNIFAGPTLKGTTKSYAGFAKVLGVYRSIAKKKERKWSLSKKQVWRLTSSTCYYCGAEPTLVSKPTGRKYQQHVEWGVYHYNGIDRVDNTKGYTQSNVVTCCVYCNRAKLDSSTNRFQKWISQVVAQQGVKQ